MKLKEPKIRLTNYCLSICSKIDPNVFHFSKTYIFLIPRRKRKRRDTHFKDDRPQDYNLPNIPHPINLNQGQPSEKLVKLEHNLAAQNQAHNLNLANLNQAQQQAIQQAQAQVQLQNAQVQAHQLAQQSSQAGQNNSFSSSASAALAAAASNVQAAAAVAAGLNGTPTEQANNHYLMSQQQLLQQQQNGSYFNGPI